MSGITVDPEGLSSAAPLYSAQASALADIHARLIARLQANGECWGNDEAGQLFAAKFVPQLNNTLQNAAAICDGLDSMAGGIHQWARNYTDTDQAVQADLASRLT